MWTVCGFLRVYHNVMLPDVHSSVFQCFCQMFHSTTKETIRGITSQKWVESREIWYERKCRIDLLHSSIYHSSCTFKALEMRLNEEFSIVGVCCSTTNTWNECFFGLHVESGTKVFFYFVSLMHRIDLECTYFVRVYPWKCVLFRRLGFRVFGRSFWLKKMLLYWTTVGFFWRSIKSTNWTHGSAQIKPIHILCMRYAGEYQLNASTSIRCAELSDLFWYLQ